MNDLGLILLGASVRGAALVAVGLGLGRAMRRKGPAASSWLALATLVGMVAIVALAASPWPRWDVLARGGARADVGPAATGSEQPAQVGGGGAAAPSAEVGSGATPALDVRIAPVDAGIGGALRILGRALLSPRVEDGARGWAWPAWLAAAGIVGVMLGLGRFALGLAAVGALRSRSRPVEDPDLLELAAILRQRAGIRRAVEVRVTPGLAMPATIGWRRPLILLPEEWKEWDDAERRVVLSHELAHIRRGDYLAGVGAQLSLALQFYHPLAHWLAYRLRLGQELAADAWGAQLSGGNRTYLTTLARLALRNEPRPVGWAARSFSPARGTFLRRIEMLRDAHDVTPTPLSRRARALALGGLVFAGLALAGLRGPGPDREALAAGLDPQAGGGVGPSIEGGFIPADAGMIAVIRPAELMASPDLKRLFESFDTDRRLQNGMPIAPADLEQVTIVWLHGDRNRNATPSGAILRAAKPQDWKAVAGQLGSGPMEEARFGEFTYSRPVQGGARGCYAATDDRTLILAEEAAIVRMLAARPGATDRAPWAEAWKGIKKGQVAVALDTSWVLVQMKPLFVNRPPGAGSPLDGFEPLVHRAHAYAVGVDLLHDLRVDGIASCNSEPATAQVADTLRAGLTLVRNTVGSFRAQAMRDGQRAPAGMKLLVDLAGPLLDKAEVAVEGRAVHVTATAPMNATRAVAALAPAVQAQRAAAKRAQSVNSMKQIGLAMHNYAQEHNNRFPAATMIGPDGKTPHSWRVAILPYIDQKALYDQYKFDEPWDGPSNSKLLDKMPVLFAHPDAPANTTSYFMTTGPHTISSDNRGSALSEITDGTSNTIMVVEAKRDIPWLKPEDIPAPAGPGAEGQPLPKLGGFSSNGFNVLFADGAVRFIADSIDPKVLRSLLSKDGGEPFSF